MLKFAIKNALCEYFFGWNLKTLLSYLRLAPSSLAKCKLWQNNENASIWDQKCLIWLFFRIELEKNIVVFVISTLEFVQFQNFVKK